jgi:hypothetical protein
MGFDVSKAYPMGWDVVGNNPDPQWGISGGKLVDYTLSELTKREDVMERVLDWYSFGIRPSFLCWELPTEFQKEDEQWEVRQLHSEKREYLSHAGLVQKAIELGMTDDELLGVE